MSLLDRFVRAVRERSAQSTVFVALLLVPLCLFAGLAVDGGYGMVQLREAQNAADASSSGAVYALQGVCAGQGAETNAAVSGVIADLVAANAPNAVGAWQAVYLNASGDPITAGATLPDTVGYAPSGACGVEVEAQPRWPTFLLSLAGLRSLSAAAEAGAIWGNSPVGAPAGSPGSTEGVPVVGGSGYTVGSGSGSGSGTTTGGASGSDNGSGGALGAGYGVGIVALAPSGIHTIFGGGSGQFVVHGDIMDDSAGNANGPDGYADTVDDFQASSTVITGHLYAVAAHPLDPCFYPAGTTVSTCASHTSGSIAYAAGMVGGLAYMPDPLSYIAAPSNAAAACAPAQTATIDPPVVGGVYSPGVYKYRPVITTSATLADCSGAPGIYIFEDGVAICPGSGDTVTGTDVMLFSDSGAATTSPVPPPPDAGPATPPAPAGAGGGCGSSSGSGDGVQIGGEGSVTLSGPTSGPWSHLVLYQDRGAQANIGLDDSADDSATIHITGAIYDNSDPTGSAQGAGILISGQLLANGPQGPGGPGSGTTTSTSGGGSIQIDGMVVVDAFSTNGTANLTITYDPAQVPDAGPVLVQ